MTSPPDKIERSGWLKAWVYSLKDITAAEMRDYIAELAEMPLKTCDAFIGCDEPAEYFINFHGCDSLTLCKEHKEALVYDTNAQMAAGGKTCHVCGNFFNIVPTLMKWNLI
jgi:hypothetical protein